NDYTGDPAVWPGGMMPDSVSALTEFDHIRAFQNTAATTRTDTCRVLFFSGDGMTFIDGFEYTIDSPTGFFFHRVNVDLSALSPPVIVQRDALVMIDYPAPAMGQPAVGVGLAFAGGDNANRAYPTPQSLVRVGTTDPTIWFFADHTTGPGGPPAMVDPNFDG